MDMKRMRACAPPLQHPGDEAVLRCLDEIERLATAIARAEGSVTGQFAAEDIPENWDEVHGPAMEEMKRRRAILDTRRLTEIPTSDKE